jgi:hypothetical protein
MMRIPSFITLLLLSLLPGASIAADRIVTVAVDTRGIGDEAYRDLGLLDLQRKLALRLTQAGYAVVAPGRSPLIRLKLSVKGRDRLGLEASAEVGAKSREAEVERGKGKLESFHLEAIHRAMAVVREVERTLPSPASQPAPTSRPATQPTKKPSRTPVTKPKPHRVVQVRKAPEPWHLEFALGGMVLYRPDGVDPLVRASGRIGIFGGLGLRGTMGFTPFFTDGLTVIELSFQGGLSWRFQLTRSLHLEPAIIVGFMQHIYEIDRATDSSGLQWDFLGNLPLELGWRFNQHLGARIWLSPGFSALSRSHSLAGEEIWKRSLFRLEAGASVVLILR